MVIKTLRDADVTIKAGTVVEADDQSAKRLIALGFAEAVEEKKAEPKKAAAKKTTKKASK